MNKKIMNKKIKTELGLNLYSSKIGSNWFFFVCLSPTALDEKPHTHSEDHALHCFCITHCWGYCEHTLL